MSNIAVERSEESAEPIELYQIKLGNRMYYLTSNSEDIRLNAINYKAVHIKRDEIVHDLKLFDERIKITLPARSDTAREMLNYASEEESYLTILRTFKGTNEYYTLWHGLIIQKNVDKEYLSLMSFPTNYAFEKVGNRGRYSRTCRHVLYSKNCGLLKVNHFVTGAVEAHTNLTVKLNFAPNTNVIGGIIEFPRLNISRMIIGFDGDRLVMLSPVFGIQNMDVVKIYRGCNKTIEQCAEYGNVENFGGYPFIPVKNIFTGSAT